MNYKKEIDNSNDNNTILDQKLLEEKLDIYKKWIKTNEVNFRREIIFEDQNIIVPIKKEYLVIEKRSLEGKNNESIRIPISEEQIVIDKKPVILEEISIYKHKYQEFESIMETLRHEEIHVESSNN